MASVDPYAPCPCGSGQKFKFCCQKVESYAERAQRMVENGQYDSALKPLAEGLAKYPDNPWLLTRKAMVEIQRERPDAAKESLKALLKKDPGHLGGTILMTRLELETEGPLAAVAQLQQGLSAMAPERRRELAPMAAFLGITLCRSGYPIAGFRHLELGQQWAGAVDEATARVIQSLRTSPSFSVWEKNPYHLSQPPEGVTEAFRESFERAMGWAREGLWASAASAFELLAAPSSAGAIAERNRGICCLWLADHSAALGALRRFIARTGPTVEAVDLEALCQRIGPITIADPVEFVRLSWPIRNRDGLLGALRADAAFEEGPNRPVDPEDAEATPTERFYLLDRPKVEARPQLTRRDIPVAEGEVLVGRDTVILETFDDGRLDRLCDRFTAAARANIPPAHPRTKVVEKVSRHVLAMSWEWRLPTDLPEKDVERLNREQRSYLIGEVWPQTPHPALRGRTPLQAAKAGDSETALRAGVRVLETSDEESEDLVDWAQFRARLGLKPEPAVDVKGLELERVHLSRFSLIPAAELDDDRLRQLYVMARSWGLRGVMNGAGRAIAERPSLVTKGPIPPTTLFGDLSLDAAVRGDRAEAESWIRRGRESEPAHKISPNALLWELLELRVRIIFDQPEVWVPALAAVLQHYRGNREALSAIMIRLVEFGLVRTVVDPKHPDRIGLDTQVLDHLMTQYGPRITTAAGDVGAAPATGGIWTPESARGGSPIWTPGTEAAAAPGKEPSKLILPGQ
jgi:tetratricopeptide (TPR) repeat protein